MNKGVGVAVHVSRFKVLSELVGKLTGFIQKSAAGQKAWMFRGHADASWPLETSLDRFVQRHGLERDHTRDRLLELFEQETQGLMGGQLGLEDPETVRLLARHSGLPSTILDWTRSPFVAAFFAFEDDVHEAETPPEHVAIWILNYDRAIKHWGDNVESIDQMLAGHVNPRAIEQQSAFLDVIHRVDFEDLPSQTLYKWEVSADVRHEALAWLSAMGITRRSMFRDLDSAARTAALKVRMLDKGAER